MQKDNAKGRMYPAKNMNTLSTLAYTITNLLFGTRHSPQPSPQGGEGAPLTEPLVGDGIA